MRDRTVHTRKYPYDFHRVRPFHPPASQAGWNNRIQESAGAQQVALGFRRTPPLVSLGGGLSERFRQLIRDLEGMLPRRNIDRNMIHSRKHDGPPELSMKVVKHIPLLHQQHDG